MITIGPGHVGSESSAHERRELLVCMVIIFIAVFAIAALVL